MANNIVTVNVTQTVAPTPSLLQQSGAMISQGATSLTAGSYSFLTQYSDLTALLLPGQTLSSLAWANGTVTATVASESVTAGTYDSVTGQVTLTLGTALTGLTAGASVLVASLAGTGTFADAEGTFTAEAGTTTTSVVYTIQTSLTMTITSGGTVAFALPSIGDTFITTIASAQPVAYNGTYLATVTTASEFTYALTADPGTETNPGTFTPSNQGELVAMATTFFAQGAIQGAYVLELGPNEPTASVAALSTFITNNPGVFYRYLVPRNWDANAAFLAFLPDYESTTALTYFDVTTTAANETSYTNLMKCVTAYVEAPGIPLTEFDAAFGFYNRLSQNPSSTNRATPFAFAEGYGVTPYPTKGNSALFSTLKTDNVNWIGTGAQGGISTAILYWGVNKDGRDGLYWYSVDWAQINASLNLANAIINGSNNPLNPLYYSQQGINSLQDVVAQTMQSAVTFGLAQGSVIKTALTGPALSQAIANGTFSNQIVVNAVPFIPYLQASPSDYKTGTYNGLSVVYIPSNGFKAILFNLNVTDFAAAA